MRPPVDVLVVVIGSNDVTGVTAPWVLRRHTLDLIDAARTVVDAPVVLAGIPLFGGPLLRPPLPWVVSAYAHVQRAVQRAAAGATVYVDVAAEASPRFAGRPETICPDGYHPSPAGYALWADAIAPAVARAYSASR